MNESNLPILSTDFVGRAADLAALAALLDRGERLVTLTGAAGIGKTRLALRYAAAAQAQPHAWPGGVWFCDLTEAHDLEQVCSVVAHALGVAARAADPVDAVGRALAARGRLLVVFDNFEQVVAAAPGTVARWLAVAPEARAVVTSRERLRLPGECAHEVGPLGLPDGTGAVAESVQLLVDRARRLRSDFAPGPATAPLLDQIVTQLDGIPLAIELAAARMNALGLADLLERLPERFDALAHGARGATGRQATLRGSIDGSWDLLTAHERAALAQCAVFRGGFTLHAAERVLALAHDAPPVAAVVQALRDKSLLRAYAPADAPATLRLGLYLSVREYAAERLGATDAARATALRHARYYVDEAEARAQDADGTQEETRSLPFLHLERENLVAAAEACLGTAPRPLGLRAVLALAPWHWVRGSYTAFLALVERALEGTSPDTGGVEPVLHARLLAARAPIAARCGRSAESLADLERALQAARDAGDRALEAYVLYQRSPVLYLCNRWDEAVATVREALSLFRALGDRRGEGVALHGLGTAALELGRWQDAREAFTEARMLFRATGDARREAGALQHLGQLLLEQQHNPQARAHLERAAALAGPQGDLRVRGHAAACLGMLCHDEGRLEEAAAHYEAARRDMHALGDRRQSALCRGYLGMARRDLGPLDDARELLEQACAELRAFGDRSYTAQFCAWLGSVLAAQGDLDAAQRCYDDAAALTRAGERARTIVELERGHREAALARAETDPARVASHRRAARERLAAAQEPTPAGTAPPVDVRLSLRALARALDALPAARAEAPAYEIHATGDWFRAPAGPRVECRTRPVLRAFVRALLAHRTRAPGEPLASDELVAAVWPGERILPAAARNRLHVTLNKLRDLGLRGLLRATSQGYLFDPDVPLRIVQDAER